MQVTNYLPPPYAPSLPDAGAEPLPSDRPRSVAENAPSSVLKRRAVNEEGEPAKRPSVRPVRPASVRPAPELSPRFGALEASSSCMQEVFAALTRLAPTEITLTLIGETGTGKDVLARAIHASSARSREAFVVFDCGAVASNLVESELFGHERGAFTGAHTTHAGAFERAQGGTLFLDEVGELPLELQPRLLRALENRSVRRVGGTTDRPIDVRILAATNRDLKLRVQAGQFRDDLYFRLAAAVVALPSLRERLDDLPILVRQLLEGLGRREVEVHPDVFDMLRAQGWPGNVRQLKNELAYALTFAEQGMVEPHHFAAPSGEEDESLDRLPLGGQPLARIERAAIKQTLALTGGSKVRTAQTLGIAVSTLYEKLKRYAL